MTEESSLFYVGLVAVFILGFVISYFYFITSLHVSTEPSAWESAGFSIDQNPGMAQVIVVDIGYLGSVGLVGPDGTRSTTMKNGELFDFGHEIKLRSNEEVISYLNNPENNITVLTTSGTKTVENVSGLPTEYQKAPDGLINPDADIRGYDEASIATVACLIDHEGIELGGKQIPANVSIPCNTPVLAQNDSVEVGTSAKPTSGPHAGKTLTSPVILKKGKYSIVGIHDDEERVVVSFEVSDETAQR